MRRERGKNAVETDASCGRIAGRGHRARRRGAPRPPSLPRKPGPRRGRAILGETMKPGADDDRGASIRRTMVPPPLTDAPRMDRQACDRKHLPVSCQEDSPQNHVPPCGLHSRLDAATGRGGPRNGILTRASRGRAVAKRILTTRCSGPPRRRTLRADTSSRLDARPSTPCPRRRDHWTDSGTGRSVAVGARLPGVDLRRPGRDAVGRRLAARHRARRGRRPKARP
jgi:hypothetical protein